MANKNLTIEGAQLRFRNFQGLEGRYNPAGVRNFCVLLDDDLASVLKEDGWNVKYLKPRDEDEDEQAYLQVAVNFNNFPPKIVMITSRNKTVLDEETVGQLDYAEIENADISIRPRVWDDNGTKRIKAYARSVYITIVEDDLDKKYANVPDSAVRAADDYED